MGVKFTLHRVPNITSTSLFPYQLYLILQLRKNTGNSKMFLSSLGKNWKDILLKLIILFLATP